MPARKRLAPKTSPNPSPITTARGAAAASPSPAIRSMFDSIAADYDRFNAWASLGLHQRWRRALVERIPASSRVLDIATGTGDVAFLAASYGHQVVGLDFSEGMLNKARQKDSEHRVRWIAGSADRLPFSDRSFNCVTSAFALRNLRGCLGSVLCENLRVLKSGGRALHMDFGRPRSGLSRLGHRWHLTYAVPLIGERICGVRWPRKYLETTIAEFYEPEEVAAKMAAAGFSKVRHWPLLWGVVQLFEGTKE
jgi:demethylmenaquinone methyltransferase / 2-methoxy-6-polyprenyl-1,4-benzoquinol methylase